MPFISNNMSTKCLGCNKELWFTDEDAGSDNQVFMRCDPCLKILNDEIDAHDKSIARASLISSCISLFAISFIIIAICVLIGASFYYFITKIE